jgi:nucleotide-binding universal stress UspA family protein
MEHGRSTLLSALDPGADAAAESARRSLARRWPDVDVAFVDKVPVTGILAEAQKFAADVIVIGWRGHGALRRVLMGSVSRAVARGAGCSVLVVRRRLRVRRIVIGLDGSAMANRAVAVVGGLVAPAHGRVILHTVVDVMTVPSRVAVARAAAVSRELKRINAKRMKAAAKELNRAAARLEYAGWRTRTILTSGEPLSDLLASIATVRPELLVIGATGSSRVRHLLLGSVADGALNRSPVPVLITR